MVLYRWPNNLRSSVGARIYVLWAFDMGRWISRSESCYCESLIVIVVVLAVVCASLT